MSRSGREALDTSRRDSVEEALFTYEVRNTQAEDLAETLNQMLGAGLGAAPPRDDAGDTEGGRGDA